MDRQISIAADDTIFSTGVFLQPVKCTINKTEQWRWVAVNFEDDSYLNGRLINPIEYSDKLETIANSFE